jgi:hypothetical protein
MTIALVTVAIVCVLLTGGISGVANGNPPMAAKAIMFLMFMGASFVISDPMGTVYTRSHPIGPQTFVAAQRFWIVKLVGN